MSFSVGKHVDATQNYKQPKKKFKHNIFFSVSSQNYNRYDKNNQDKDLCPKESVLLEKVYLNIVKEKKQHLKRELCASLY